jgi:DNA-binding CsgD family transcriptional regulator
MQPDAEPTSIPAPLASLSKGQVEVLALVAQYKSSKEIARALNISPNTVDQRLKRVQALLGTNGRFEAARLYTSAMRGGGTPELWGDLVYQPSDLSSASDPAIAAASAGLEDRTVGGATFMRQPQASLANGFRSWDEERSWTSIFLEAGRPNELSWLARTAVVGGSALVAVLALAAVVALAEGLSRIF